MNLLAGLKASALAQWLSTSMLGVPTLMAVHSVGMAVAVGMSLVITLRLYRFFGGFTNRQIARFLGIAFWGFAVNFVTGLGIFITRGADYIASLLFDFKMLLVLAAAVTMLALRRRILNSDAGDGTLVFDDTARVISLAATASLFAAVIAGRLLAYLSNLY